MGLQQVDIGREAAGYHQLNTAAITSATKVPGVGSVVTLQAELQPVRYRPDDVDPTSSVGVLLAAGESHTLNVGHGNISKIRVIRTVAGAILNVMTFK